MTEWNPVEPQKPCELTKQPMAIHGKVENCDQTNQTENFNINAVVMKPDWIRPRFFKICPILFISECWCFL